MKQALGQANLPSRVAIGAPSSPGLRPHHAGEGNEPTRPWADPRPQLARLATPALVIKGSCDYLSWATGVDYRHALANAKLVYLHRAGHNAYQDQPAAFLATVRAFLTGRPLAIAPWTGTGVPSDYEGPDGHPIAGPVGSGPATLLAAMAGGLAPSSWR